MPVEVFSLEKLTLSNATLNAESLQKLFQDLVSCKQVWFDTPFSRSELFFGHVLGGNKRRVTVNKRRYVANRIPYGAEVKKPGPIVTSYEPIHSIFRPIKHHFGLIDEICANAASRLAEASKHKGPKYLQCNVNLYSGHEPMKWHRDDRLDSKKHPLTNTFYPASATFILLSEAVKNHKDFRLRVYVPAKQNTQDYSDVEGARYCDDLPYIPPCLEPCPDMTFDRFGELIVLSEAAYTHGLHTAGIGEVPQGEEFIRMSWNFRLVKEDAWLALKGERADLHPWPTPDTPQHGMAIAAE